MPPDVVLERLLDRIVLRMRMAAVSTAAAAGLAAGAVAGLLLASQGRAPRAGAMAAVAAGVWATLMWRTRGGRTRRGAASAAERRDPSFRNLLVTAEELCTHPGRASSWMRDRVLADVARRADEVRPAAIVRLGQPIALSGLGLLAWLLVWSLPPPGPAGRVADVVGGPGRRMTAGQAPDGGFVLTVLVHPPAYTNLPAREERDPERLDVVEGTHVRIRIAAGDAPVRARLGTRALDVSRIGPDVEAEVVLRESGYFAIESDVEGGGAGARRLVPVQVTPDRAPAVRVQTPGRDLLLPPGAGAVPIAVVAHDDFGLEMLEIRYTKVSGSGEQFEFEEGTLPARVSRSTAREWRAEAELPVGALALGAGDSIVYRAVARDARPGEAGLASSDTFFVEIQGRGLVLLEGLEMPPEQERYAFSQQMVVLKIERLRAREPAMTPDAVRAEAALIAAEQRAVRANFIFLMGGHVEDEVEEAEHSHEIQEGRLENSARKDISTAIHYMTGSEQGLTAVSTEKALPPARAAVDALQRAFGRNRYILRSLAVQSRIDPSRRLTGSLQAATDWRRGIDRASEDPVERATRGVLAGLLAAAATVESEAPLPPGRLAAIAEQVLTAAPDSAEWRQVAEAIMAAQAASESNQPRETVRAHLHEAIAPVLREARLVARRAPGAGMGTTGALERAWGDEVRR